MSALENRSPRRLVPANDNGKRRNPLRVALLFPQHLPVQTIEVEVIAQLLDSIVCANDNEAGAS